MTTESEIAWAAGLFEGEGWISIQRKTPLIGIQMADKEILERFQSIVGCGKIYYRKPRIYSYERIKTRKEQWAWRLQGREKVGHLLDVLSPWLGSRRKGRAKEVMTIAATSAKQPGMPKGYQTKKVLNRLHGDVRKYWSGCRCVECRKAVNAYCTQKRRTKLHNSSQ